MIPTSGVWAFAERNTFFLACTPINAGVLLAQEEAAGGAFPEPLYVLLAVNDLNPESAKDVELLERLIASGARVLLDSGVFWLTNRHKRAHGISMDEALRLHPDEVDGFDWLWDRYTKLGARFGDSLWGMIELDQGGARRKRETRGRLHDLGLKPIPVYHPLVDGWDYFDELAETHDRLCFGNVVQAPTPTRSRLLATAWERTRAYPHLWVHLLGYSLSEYLHAYPVESCDSSSWLTILRWSAAARDQAMNKAFGTPPVEMRYRYDAERDAPDGHMTAIAMAGAMWRMNVHNYRSHLTNLEEFLNDSSFR